VLVVVVAVGVTVMKFSVVYGVIRVVMAGIIVVLVFLWAVVVVRMLLVVGRRFGHHHHELDGWGCVYVINRLYIYVLVVVVVVVRIYAAY